MSKSASVIARCRDEGYGAGRQGDDKGDGETVLEGIGSDEILEPGLGLVVDEEVTEAIGAVSVEEGVVEGESDEAVEDGGFAVDGSEGERRRERGVGREIVWWERV